jgi:hypothetical protein
MQAEEGSGAEDDQGQTGYGDFQFHWVLRALPESYPRLPQRPSQVLIVIIAGQDGKNQ